MAYGVRKERRRRGRKAQLLVLLAISLIAICSVIVIWKVGEFVYDYYARFSRYDELIVKAGQRNNVDPCLINAVIWKESRFDKRARGLKGEVGLMQIMPDLAAADWARIKGFPAPSRGALYDPELNIEIGSWYLGRALRKWRAYRENIPMALSEYNAGARRVNQWKPVSRDGAFRERIAIPSTRDYVDEIMVKYQDYRRNWKP